MGFNNGENLWQRTNIGIASLLNDKEFNLAPEGLKRIKRREEYKTNPEHTSLKYSREKRDQLKEKRFQAQQKKNTPSTKGDE
jgi:lysine 2,3-aminomutase